MSQDSLRDVVQAGLDFDPTGAASLTHLIMVLRERAVDDVADALLVLRKHLSPREPICSGSGERGQVIELGERIQCRCGVKFPSSGDARVPDHLES